MLQGGNVCVHLSALIQPIYVMLLPPSPKESVQPMLTPDKCPGVRPIGIGEVIRRIIGKAISITLKYDIQDAAGPVQLCTSHNGGCEAAIHAMHQLFNLPHTNAVIQVDASNAFNSLNRQTALRNVLNLCPSLAKVTDLMLNSTSMEKPSCLKRAQHKHNTRRPSCYGHVCHQHSSPHSSTIQRNHKASMVCR